MQHLSIKRTLYSNIYQLPVAYFCWTTNLQSSVHTVQSNAYTYMLSDVSTYMKPIDNTLTMNVDIELNVSTFKFCSRPRWLAGRAKQWYSQNFSQLYYQCSTHPSNIMF